MSTAELKLDSINQIARITDKVRLKELLQILEFQNETHIYITSEEEKKAVLAAQNDIANGNVKTNANVQKEISEWLKK